MLLLQDVHEVIDVNISTGRASVVDMWNQSHKMCTWTSFKQVNGHQHGYAYWVPAALTTRARVPAAYNTWQRASC